MTVKRKIQGSGGDECKIEGKAVFLAIPSDVFYDSK